MSKWTKARLGDCCEITSSKRIFYSDYVESGVPFYRSKEIIESFEGVRNFSETLYITEERYNEIRSRFGVPAEGDLLLTSVGTIGVPYLVKQGDRFYFKDGNLTWFRNFKKTLDSKFLFYWLQTNQGKGELDAHTIGSSQKALTIRGLKEVSIRLPDIEQQQRMISILSDYDSAIDNARRQIALLEEAAMRLYREWFGDGKGERKRLGDIADIVMGQSPSSDSYNHNREGLPFHQGVADFGVRFPTNEIWCRAGTRFANAGDILFSVRAPVGRINVSKEKIVIGRGLSAMRERRDFQCWLLYALKSYFTTEDMIGSGCIFASTTKNELFDVKLPYPSEKVIKKFNAIVQPMDNALVKIDSHIRKLTEARDRLLPKLMSGEVSV